MKTKQTLHKRLLAMLLSLCMLCGMLPFTASALEVDAGTGTKDNPLPIRTAQELADIAGMINSGALYSVLDMPAGETVYYRLEADISLADYTGGNGWTPIGTQDTPFTGVFDGNGHTISGMRITGSISWENYAGLFGVIGKKGSVSSLRIADSRIELNANAAAGLLAGKCEGTVENCEIGGTVKAVNAGGLAGELAGGTVKNCLVTARVTALRDTPAGGLYAKGAADTLTACAVLSPEVNGSTAYALGPDAADKAKACVAWDGMGGTPDFGGASATSIDALQSADTWEAMGDGALTKAPWTYEAGLLPSLAGKGQPVPSYMLGGFAGSGTEGNPYQISSLDDLRTFAEMIKSDGAPGIHFKLMTNLDMAGYTYEDEEKGWKPLTPFRGIFDGGRYAIQNLYINRPDEDNIGFFSGIHGDADYFGEDRNPTIGIVHDLGIVDCDITGNAQCGALTGELYGAKIERCYSTGKVLGGRRYDNPEEMDHNHDPMAETGGLVGWGAYGIIRACYSTADVRGVFAVGGIAGQFHGTLTDCYTTGNVTGDYGNGVGGILGLDHSDGTVFRRCYSVSKVQSGPLLFGPINFGNACGTGGIAGWTIGAATDLVALNPSVDSDSDRKSWVSKCVGYVTYNPTADHERVGGWMGTVVNGKESGVTSAWDSYGMAYVQPNTWREFAASGAWDIQDGKLPLLRNVGGPQDGTPADELINDDYSKLYDDPPYENGPDDPIYYIDTPANLAWCSLNASLLSNKILQFRAETLDLSAYTMNGGWIPIGSYESKTTGLKVIGNNCVVTGLTIQRAYEKYAGLFGYLYSASIEELHLRGVEIDVDNGVRIGMLAADLVDGARVVNCSVQGSIRHMGIADIGGMIGKLPRTTMQVTDFAYDFYNLSASGRIENAGLSKSSVGGLIGHWSAYSTASHKLYNAYTNVDINGGRNSGGVIGGVETYTGDLTIKNCYSRGSINGGGAVGGIIGKMENILLANGGQTVSLSDCYAAGSLSGTNAVGGIVGDHWAGLNEAAYPPDKNITVDLSNVAALAESVSGKQVGRIFGGWSQGSGNPLSYVDIKASGLYSWDGTEYRVDGKPANPLWKGQVKSYSISPLTTAQVMGRVAEDDDTATYRYFSDINWKDGWSAFSPNEAGKSRAAGRLPTLTFGNNAENHIHQVGDVPLYISMKEPKYIEEMGVITSNETPGKIGVYSRADLDYLRAYFEQYEGWVYVELARDIDMNKTNFVPIGHADSNPFTGVVDGRGHVIKNLHVSTQGENDAPAGLFGSMSSASVYNLGLVDPLIVSSGPKGAIAGRMIDSRLVNCFVSATGLRPGSHYPSSVSSNSESAGGLVGYAESIRTATLIQNCYSAINVQGWKDVGGLIGTVRGGARIENVFTAGQVSTFPEDGAGGLVGGVNGDINISNAVILSSSVEAPKESDTAGYILGVVRSGTCKIGDDVKVFAQTRARGAARGDLESATELDGRSATLEALHELDSWSGFASNVWQTAAGKTPVLKLFTGVRQGNFLPELPIKIDALEPNAEGWYEIHSTQDWLTMCNMVNTLIVPYSTANYKLMADIELTNLYGGYQPVGQGAAFLGEFDGNGKTVVIEAQLLDGGGLFGRLGSGANVHDLTIEAAIQSNKAETLGGAAGMAEKGSTLQNITVTGSIQASGIYRVGGIIGDSAGTVENCVNLASVTASKGDVSYLQAGGIAGRQRGGVIDGCRNEGRVDAGRSGSAAGGLVGNTAISQALTQPSLQNSRNTGSVSGTDSGGLIGSMTGGLVRGCGSTGDVYGTAYGGGLVGRMTCPAGYASGLTDGYATGSVSGGLFAGGLIGSLEASAATQPNRVVRCYATGRVTTDGSTAGGAVGYLVWSKNLTFTDVAALNPQVSTKVQAGDIEVGAFVGRIETQPTLVNCFAFDEMVLPDNPAKVNGVETCGKENFATISANAAFWNDQMDFGGDPSLWNSSGGEGAEVKLPTLLHINGTQSGELPYHLRTFARPQNTTLTLAADKDELWSPKGQAETVVFTAKITGTTETAVKWSCSDTTLTATGGTDENGNPICTLTIPAGYKETYSGGEITVTATLKKNNAIVSEPFTVTVKARQNAKAPEITVQPKDTPTVVGKPAKLSVTARSQDGGTLSYQWYKTDLADKTGQVIDGAAGAAYEAPATETGIWYYYCVVTNTIHDGEGIGNTAASVKSGAAKVEVTKDAQQALTIVGGNVTATYGDGDFTLQTSGGSGTGDVNWQSSNPAVVSVDKSGKVIIHKAGAATITAAKAGDHQFDPSSARITITVNKAALTVTADDKTREYEQANPALTYTYSGFVKGEDASVLTKQPTAACTAGLDAAVGTHSITVSGGEAENYEFVYVSGTLTVTKTGQNTLSILQGGQINKSYGDGAFILSVTGGSGNGAVSWQSSDDSVASVDQTGKVTIHKAGTAAITAVKAADGSYVEARASAMVTVKKATLTVTAQDADKQFGEENPELTYAVTGFVKGEDKNALTKQPTISVDTELSAAELPVGSYVIKVEGGEAANYDFVYNNATLIVNKADQSTFQIEGGNPVKAYGDAPFTLTTKNGAGGAVTWQSGDESVATVNEATGEVTIVGAGKVQITAVSAETGNFAEAIAAVTLTVEKAKLQINADLQTRVYGDENPAFTYTIEGFVNGDGQDDLDELPVLTADADKTTGVGSYAIRLLGGTDDNYAYVLNNAELTITPRPVTITADDKEMTEGGDLPELTWTVTGGNILDGDTLEGSLKADGTGAGAHPITQDTPFANPNYAVTFLPGTLTVAEKPKEPIIPEPKPNPPTGDDSPIWPFWMALLSLCGIGGALLSARRRKAEDK